MLKVLTPAEVVRRLLAIREEAEMAKSRKGMVHKSIAPKRPTRAAKARARLGLPPIPKGPKPGGMPGAKS